MEKEKADKIRLFYNLFNVGMEEINVSPVFQINLL